jgi:uncharacterized metal-binding protein YceD (DUF177 family)
MDESFRIYIDRMREGQREEIEESVDSSFLQIDEEELRFDKPVDVTGEAYIATDHLVLHLHAETEALVPCAICNTWVPVNIVLNELYLTEPIADIRSGIYNFGDALREEILLAVPQFAECNDGQCKNRKDIEKYLKKPTSKKEEEGYKPFENL